MLTSTFLKQFTSKIQEMTFVILPIIVGIRFKNEKDKKIVKISYEFF